MKIILKEAKKARHRQHRFGAVLIRGGKPIEAAHNHSFIHAEHAVLNRAWRSDIDGSTIVVARLRKDGSLGMAKPCDLCMSRLIEAGVRKVVYTNNVGELETMRLPSKKNNVKNVPVVYPFKRSYYPDMPNFVWQQNEKDVD